MAQVRYEFEYQWGPLLRGYLGGEVASVAISKFPDKAEITQAKRSIHKELLSKINKGI